MTIREKKENIHKKAHELFEYIQRHYSVRDKYLQAAIHGMCYMPFKELTFKQIQKICQENSIDKVHNLDFVVSSGPIRSSLARHAEDRRILTYRRLEDGSNAYRLNIDWAHTDVFLRLEAVEAILLPSLRKQLGLANYQLQVFTNILIGAYLIIASEANYYYAFILPLEDFSFRLLHKVYLYIGWANVPYLILHDTSDNLEQEQQFIAHYGSYLPMNYLLWPRAGEKVYPVFLHSKPKVLWNCCPPKLRSALELSNSKNNSVELVELEEKKVAAEVSVERISTKAKVVTKKKKKVVPEAKIEEVSTEEKIVETQQEYTPAHHVEEAPNEEKMSSQELSSSNTEPIL
ncbi:MAG: hypothetical protein RML72_01625 [Bacteroidia bacterium]|nr:hypothetical protein [Bacteroidia bacterium]MDW8157559.1 hypothetical protein [Bacteroidia bacterium]